jgi:hypothetical protein
MQLTIDQATTIVNTRIFTFRKPLTVTVAPSVLYYHLVFQASDNLDSIGVRQRRDFYGFIFGCARTLGGKIESIGGRGVSVQILVALDPAETPSAFIRKLKLFSAAWAKRKLNLPDFAWRSAEVASVSRSQCRRISSSIQSRNFLF